MKTTYIYSLSDENNNIRYIGKSNNPKNRLYSHLKEDKSNPHKYNWLKSIIKRGFYPILTIIEEVQFEDWQIREKYWISHFRLNGFDLLNITDGGDGGNGYKHSIKSRMKMRKAKLGISLPKEHREKISKAVKDKSIESPNYNKCHDKTHTIDSDILYQKYIIENLSLNKCAKFFNTSKHTIFRNITEKGFKKTKDVWEHQLSTRPKKSVLQYDLNDNFIREWSSPVDIKNELGFNSGNISSCCRGSVKSANGYKWKYKDNI